MSGLIVFLLLRCITLEVSIAVPSTSTTLDYGSISISQNSFLLLSPFVSPSILYLEHFKSVMPIWLQPPILKSSYKIERKKETFT